MRAALLQGLSGLILAAVWPLLYGRYGTGAFFWLALLVSTMLLLLADIDSRTWLLPDALTLSLLWLGVTVAWLGWGLVSLHASVAGLGSAYLLMALIRILGARACGPDALGAGDVKLVAALGAWFGDAAVMPVLLAACLGALMYAMVCQRRWRPRGMVPFGPFLAVAGGAALFSPSALQSWF